MFTLVFCFQWMLLPEEESPNILFTNASITFKAANLGAVFSPMLSCLLKRV